MINKIKHDRNRAQFYRQYIINIWEVEIADFVKNKNRSFLKVVYKLTNTGILYNKV